jgi:hypothetical protein
MPGRFLVKSGSLKSSTNVFDASSTGVSLALELLSENPVFLQKITC